MDWLSWILQGVVAEFSGGQTLTNYVAVSPEPVYLGFLGFLVWAFTHLIFQRNQCFGVSPVC